MLSSQNQGWGGPSFNKSISILYSTQRNSTKYILIHCKIEILLGQHSLIMTVNIWVSSHQFFSFSALFVLNTKWLLFLFKIYYVNHSLLHYTKMHGYLKGFDTSALFPVCWHMSTCNREKKLQGWAPLISVIGIPAC